MLVEAVYHVGSHWAFGEVLQVVAVLALQSDQVTVQLQVVLDLLEGKLFKRATKAAQGISWALTTLHVALQLGNRVHLYFLRFRALVPYEQPVQDLLQHIRLHVAKDLESLGFTVETRHVPALTLLVFGEASVAYNL